MELKKLIFEERRKRGIEEYLDKEKQIPKYAKILKGDLKDYLGKLDTLEFTHASMKKDYHYMKIKF